MKIFLMWLNVILFLACGFFMNLTFQMDNKIIMLKKQNDDYFDRYMEAKFRP